MIGPWNDDEPNAPSPSILNPLPVITPLAEILLLNIPNPSCIEVPVTLKFPFDWIPAPDIELLAEIVLLTVVAPIINAVPSNWTFDNALTSPADHIPLPVIPLLAEMYSLPLMFPTTSNAPLMFVAFCTNNLDALIVLLEDTAPLNDELPSINNAPPLMFPLADMWLNDAVCATNNVDEVIAPFTNNPLPNLILVSAFDHEKNTLAPLMNKPAPFAATDVVEPLAISIKRSSIFKSEICNWVVVPNTFKSPLIVVTELTPLPATVIASFNEAEYTSNAPVAWLTWFLNVTKLIPLIVLALKSPFTVKGLSKYIYCSGWSQ